MSGLLREVLNVPQYINNERVSRKLAFEAVKLFANGNKQEPVSTYLANSQSTVLDLTRLNPGTIIRTLEDRPASNGSPLYNWFVIGQSNDKHVSIYWITHNKNGEIDLTQQDRLQLGASWTLRKMYTKITKLEINHASRDLFGLKPLFPHYTSRQVDIMNSGNKVNIDKKRSIQVGPFFQNPALTPNPV